jgi:hypothetical protein
MKWCTDSCTQSPAFCGRCIAAGCTIRMKPLRRARHSLLSVLSRSIAVLHASVATEVATCLHLPLANVRCSSWVVAWYVNRRPRRHAPLLLSVAIVPTEVQCAIRQQKAASDTTQLTEHQLRGHEVTNDQVNTDASRCNEPC